MSKPTGIDPVKLTAAANKATEMIMADLKKMGRGLMYKRQYELEKIRQLWVGEFVRYVYEEFRNGGMV